MLSSPMIQAGLKKSTYLEPDQVLDGWVTLYPKDLISSQFRYNNAAAAAPIGGGIVVPSVESNQAGLRDVAR